MITTSMVKDNTMPVRDYHAGVAFAYAPQRDYVEYYQAFAEWRLRLARGVKAAEKHLLKIWSTEA